ncbi:MAG: hypothetical protein ACM3PU_01580 [Gemmatimonadota bacterium]
MAISLWIGARIPRRRHPVGGAILTQEWAEYRMRYESLSADLRAWLKTSIEGGHGRDALV